MIYGVMLVLVIAFAPRGLVGTLTDLRAGLTRRFGAPRKTAEVARG